MIQGLLDEGFNLGFSGPHHVVWIPCGTDNITVSYYGVDVTSLLGRDDIDLQVIVMGKDFLIYGEDEKVLNKIIPSGIFTIINSIKSGQTGA